VTPFPKAIEHAEWVGVNWTSSFMSTVPASDVCVELPLASVLIMLPPLVDW
jgi:hypothetical protein